MQDNKPTELTSITIDGITYPSVTIYGLTNAGHITDHSDEYCFGDSAQVITGIDFDLVVIHLYGGTIEVDTHNEHWQSVKKQVAEHILNDHEFMQAWQDRDFTND